MARKPAKKTQPKSTSGNSNQLRIIGGSWRGRKLPFPDAPGLRPSLDRVRETLFNWLQFDISGAHCLDLFSGSGALGFEALSRGANLVTFVDSNPSVIRQLRQNLKLLESGQTSSRAEVLQSDALDYLSSKAPSSQPKVTYDVVFLDPPFHKDLLSQTCLKLNHDNWLNDEAYIYIEAEQALQLAELPENWTPLKEKKAGQLKYYLFQYQR